MCAGSSAVVREVTRRRPRRVEVERDRVDVGEHGARALVDAHVGADATNENGLVITSSPAPTPTARSARCSPAVPDETALACACADARGEGASKRGRIGPSESRPERRTSSTSSSSRRADDGLGQRYGLLGWRHDLLA